MKMEGKKTVLTAVAKLVKAEAGLEQSKRGPFCYGIFYQPKRPKKQ